MGDDGSHTPTTQDSVCEGVRAVEELLAPSDRQLIYAAEYEDLWPVVIGWAPVRAHIVKINWSGEV
jgi:hypothetical protein